MRRLTCLLFALVLLAGCGGRAAPTPLPPTPTPSYRQIAINHLRNMVDALLKLNPLLEAQDVADAGWVAEVGMWTSQARFAHQMLTEASPPPASVALHKQVLAATGDCDAALVLVEDGIAKSDRLLLTGGGTLLEECYSGFSAAVETLEQASD